MRMLHSTRNGIEPRLWLPTSHATGRWAHEAGAARVGDSSIFCPTALSQQKYLFDHMDFAVSGPHAPKKTVVNYLRRLNRWRCALRYRLVTTYARIHQTNQVKEKYRGATRT